jgi:hypothetical protein
MYEPGTGRGDFAAGTIKQRNVRDQLGTRIHRKCPASRCVGCNGDCVRYGDGS